MSTAFISRLNAATEKLPENCIKPRSAVSSHLRSRRRLLVEALLSRALTQPTRWKAACTHRPERSGVHPNRILLCSVVWARPYKEMAVDVQMQTDWRSGWRNQLWKDTQEQDKARRSRSINETVGESAPPCYLICAVTKRQNGEEPRPQRHDGEACAARPAWPTAPAVSSSSEEVGLPRAPAKADQTETESKTDKGSRGDVANVERGTEVTTAHAQCGWV